MSEVTPISQHEGKKYLRRIRGAGTDKGTIEVDVYAVLVAFDVTCPARAHAIKKLLCAGSRGKGDVRADLVGAIAAINRAIELCPTVFTSIKNEWGADMKLPSQAPPA